MSYITLPEFDETGYVVLDSYDQSPDPQEWLDITYVDWKSSGDTRFAPLASAFVRGCPEACMLYRPFGGVVCKELLLPQKLRSARFLPGQR